MPRARGAQAGQDAVPQAPQEVPVEVIPPADGAADASEKAPASAREDKPWLWKPGVGSPNPGGRRKTDPVIVALLKDKSLAAAQTLVSLMEDPHVSPKVRCQAAEAILDRLYGKAVQPIDAQVGGNGDPVIIAFQGVLQDWAK